MKRQQSLEDYVETILILKQRLGEVRSIDVVRELNFSKPSVSVAMKNLREKNLIFMDENGYIELTASGLQLAEKVYARHTLLTDVLLKIGVSEETARNDACLIEHDLSNETYEKLKAYFENK